MILKNLADAVTDITIQVCNSNSAWLITDTNGSLTVSAVKNIGYIEADKIVNILLAKFDLRNISILKTVTLENSKYEESLENNSATLKCLAIAPLKVTSESNRIPDCRQKNRRPV